MCNLKGAIKPVCKSKLLFTLRNVTCVRVKRKFTNVPEKNFIKNKIHVAFFNTDLGGRY